MVVVGVAVVVVVAIIVRPVVDMSHASQQATVVRFPLCDGYKPSKTSQGGGSGGRANIQNTHAVAATGLFYRSCKMNFSRVRCSSVSE